MKTKIKAISLFLFIILALSFIFITNENILTTVWANPTKSTLKDGESVVYYLKAFNSKLFNLDSMTEVIFDPRLEHRTIRSSGDELKEGSVVKNNNPQNTITWSEIRSIQGSIIFPEVQSKVRSSEGQLSLIFAKGRVAGTFDTGERFFSVLNKGIVQTCYERDLSFTKLNNFVHGSHTSLYFLPFEGEETCNASLIDNRPIVSIVINKKSFWDDVIITSPLIPDACNGKNFNNVLSNDGVLKITMEMCNENTK